MKSNNSNYLLQKENSNWKVKSTIETKNSLILPQQLQILEEILECYNDQMVLQTKFHIGDITVDITREISNSVDFDSRVSSAVKLTQNEHEKQSCYSYGDKLFSSSEELDFEADEDYNPRERSSREQNNLANDSDEQKQKHMQQRIKNNENYQFKQIANPLQQMKKLDKISQKNIVKNLVQSFSKFLSKPSTVQDLKQLKMDEKYQLIDEIHLQFTNFMKDQKFNNQLIRDLLFISDYKEIFAYYLEYKAIDWLRESKIFDKDSHYIMIQFFIMVLKNPDKVYEINSKRGRQKSKTPL